MATANVQCAESALALTTEERSYLLDLLEQELRNKSIEVHRTEASDFRKMVQAQEEILRGLIGKLRRL